MLRAGQADQSVTAQTRVGQNLLDVGFAFALLLAVVCLVGSTLYLFYFFRYVLPGHDAFVLNQMKSFQTAVNTPPGTNNQLFARRLSALEGILYVTIDARLVISRLALLSCGVCIGLSFGFLGFAL